MTLPRAFCISTILLLVSLMGCTRQQNPQDLKEKTAQATADMKQDAKAVAAGIREGWNRNDAVDLNSASRDQLMSLPGLSEKEAERVIAARPYDQPSDVVTRHILSKAEYDRIAARVTVKK